MTALGLAANIPALCLTSVSGEFGLGASLGGTFLSALFWGIGLSLLVIGPLADRTGFRAPLIVSAILEAAGLFWVAEAHSFRALCCGAFLTGLGIGTADALATPLACALYREQRTRVTNILHSFYPVGMILAILLALFLMDRWLSWRGMYRLIGVLCLPPAVIFCFPSLPSHAHEGAERLTSRRLVRSPVFWILGATIFLTGVSELGPAQWLPAFVEKVASLSPDASAAADPLRARRLGMIGMLLYGLAMTAGRTGSAWAARRFTASAMLSIGSAIVAGGLLLACALPQAWAAIAFLAVSGLGVAALWPTTLALAGDRFPQAGASMFALLPAMGNLGGVTGPLVIGCVAEVASLRAGMAVLAAAPLLIILLVRRLQLRAWEPV
jgi:fucose permease